MAEEGEVEVQEVAVELVIVEGLKQVLRKAQIFDGLRRGLHE